MASRFAMPGAAPVDKAALLPEALREALRDSPRIALAFSGGVDSRFLACAALACGCDIVAIHASGPHIAPAETDFALEWLEKRRLPHGIIAYDPLPLPEVACNGRRRCYFCKKTLFENIKAYLAAKFAGQWILCDGGHAGDLKVYRPGLAAVREAGVISPLAKAGLEKADIRRLARAIGMDMPEQRARPCLLTRLNYGLKPDAAMLAALAECEEALADILPPDMDFRLRLRPEPVLQISAEIASYKDGILETLAKHGFAGAKILEGGNISGFFDNKSDKKGV